MWYNEETKPTPTGLKCPITDSELLYVGREQHVMDGDSYYQSESDPSVKFSRHPFLWQLFSQVERHSIRERPLRYFKLNEDNTWEEYIKVEGLSDLLPVNTPQSEIEELVAKEVREKAERLANYEAKVASGEIIPFPICTRKSDATLTKHDFVSVQPLPPPSDVVHYLDYSYTKDDVATFAQKLKDGLKTIVPKFLLDKMFPNTKN